MIADGLFSTAGVFYLMAVVFVLACADTSGAALKFRKTIAFVSFMLACALTIVAAWVGVLT